jgi:cell division inhibitor SepF
VKIKNTEYIGRWYKMKGWTKFMERPWWMTKKNEPADTYDDSYDSVYYGTKDPDSEAEASGTRDADGAYDGYGDSEVSEVKVAWSEENAKEVAKVDEPLMKKTFTPATCQDSTAIVDAYKDGKVVIICVEELDKANFLRLFDYVMGAVQALDGELRRLDRDTVVLLPYGVEEDIDIDGLEEAVAEEESNDDVKDAD